MGRKEVPTSLLNSYWRWIVRAVLGISINGLFDGRLVHVGPVTLSPRPTFHSSREICRHLFDDKRIVHKLTHVTLDALTLMVLMIRIVPLANTEITYLTQNFVPPLPPPPDPFESFTNYKL